MTPCPRCGTKTTAANHCDHPIHQPAICTCHHGAIAHQYLLGTGRNNGQCLAPNCACDEFEESN